MCTPSDVYASNGSGIRTSIERPDLILDYILGRGVTLGNVLPYILEEDRLRASLVLIPGPIASRMLDLALPESWSWDQWGPGYRPKPWSTGK